MQFQVGQIKWLGRTICSLWHLWVGECLNNDFSLISTSEQELVALKGFVYNKKFCKKAESSRVHKKGSVVVTLLSVKQGSADGVCILANGADKKLQRCACARTWFMVYGLLNMYKQWVAFMGKALMNVLIYSLLSLNHHLRIISRLINHLSVFK